MICILQFQNKDPTMNIRTCVQNMLTCTNILDFTLTAWLIKYDKHSSPNSFNWSHGARYTIVRRNQRARMRILKMPARTDSGAAHCNLTGKDGDTTSRCLSWAVLTSALRGMFFHDLHNQLLTSFPQNSTFTAFGNKDALVANETKNLLKLPYSKLGLTTTTKRIPCTSKFFKLKGHPTQICVATPLATCLFSH